MNEVQAIKEQMNSEKVIEPKRTRFEKRLEDRKKSFLDKLLLDFFTDRSALKDPEGETSADLFDFYRKQWVNECVRHNRLRSPIKLNYDAYDKAVAFYLDQEKTAKITTEAANRLQGYEHWFRRSKVWRTRPLNSIWFYIKALGNQEKVVTLWQKYYLENVIDIKKKRPSWIVQKLQIIFKKRYV
jgi:hypothetical protein